MAPPTSLDLTAALFEIAGSPKRNVSVQVTKRSEKTIFAVLGGLLQVDSRMKAPQVFYLCDKEDRVKEIQHVVARFVTDGGKITACTVTPTAARPLKGAKVEDQVVIGTSGSVKRWVTMYKFLDPTRIKSVVIDEADQMLDQADNIRRILKHIGKSGRNFQVLLFSAISSEIVKSSAMKKVPEVDNCFSIVLDKPSHFFNCRYQSSCEVTLKMIITLDDRLSKAGITGTICQILSQTPDAPGNTFRECLTILINNTSSEEEKRELLQLQNEYQSLEDGCVTERKKLHDHNVGIIKGQIKGKASEKRELVAKVNGISSSTDLILVEQVGRRNLPEIKLDPICRACMAASSSIETVLEGPRLRISESDPIFHA